VLLSGRKNSMQRLFIEKCLLRKVAHNWVEKFSHGSSKFAGDDRPGADVAETTVRRLVCCGFRRAGKAMGQVYQCWWRTCQEINVISRFEYHMYPLVAYLLALPRITRRSNRGSRVGRKRGGRE
jgi:hypothetical protein